MIKFATVLMLTFVLLFGCGDSSDNSESPSASVDLPPVEPPPPPLAYECDLASPDPLYAPDIVDNPQLQIWQCADGGLDHIQTNHTSQTPTYSKNYHCINGIGFFIEDYNLFEWWDAAYLSSYYTIMAAKRSDEDCYRVYCLATGSLNAGYCESFIP